MSKLNVLYLTDNNYVIFAGVSIISLFENNRNIDEIDVYVIDDAISDENKRIYEEIAEKYRRKIIFLDVSRGVEILKKLGAPTYRNSYTTYLKLFAFDLIPDTVDRLFFIDSDTIIVGDLSDVLSIDMKGKMIGAVKDGLSHSYKVALGYPEEDSWYNMGVMLVDIVKWKQQNAQNKVIEQLKLRNAYVAVDQDILNITQHDNIIPIDSKYNATPHHYVYSYKAFMKAFKQKGFYTKEEMENGEKNAVIRHFERFLGQSPWHKGSIHPYTKLFDKYLELSPWRGYEKKEANRSFKFKILRMLYRILPHNWFVHIWAKGFNNYLKTQNERFKNNTNIDNIT